jgi:hypothetical protein
LLIKDLNANSKYPNEIENKKLAENNGKDGDYK